MRSVRSAEVRGRGSGAAQLARTGGRASPGTPACPRAGRGRRTGPGTARAHGPSPSGPGSPTGGADRGLRRRERLPGARARAPRASATAASSTLVGGHDALGEPEGERLVRRHLPAGVDEFARPAGPDQPREPLRAARARDHAEPDLGLADRGVVGEVAQVGARAPAPTRRPARTRSPRRSRSSAMRLQQVAGRARARRRSASTSSGPHSAIALMSAPAAKIFGPPQITMAPDVVAVGGLADRLLELEAHLEVDRVRGRPVQADHADTVVDLEPHELRHGADATRSPAAPRRAARSEGRASPSARGVGRTPNAAAASGASARAGIAEDAAAVGRRHGHAQQPLERPAASPGGAVRHRGIGASGAGQRAAASSAARHDVGTLERPGAVQVAGRSSAAATTAAPDRRRRPGATGRSPRRRSTTGGSASGPLRPPP